MAFEPTDRDEKDEQDQPSVNARLWASHSEGQGWELPHLLFIDQNNILVGHADCPRTVDEVLALMREHGP